MKHKLKYAILFLFVWLIVLTISFFIRVEPNIVWSGDTFIGVFVAAIGIAVAFIVGYQIYNAVDIKAELRNMRNDNHNFTDHVQNSISVITRSNNDFRADIDNKVRLLKQSISSAEEQITILNASVKEGISVLDALRIADDSGNISNYLNAFAKMHEALLNGLDYESNNYPFILDSMREFAKRICTQSFGGSFTVNQDGFYFGSPSSNYAGRALKEVLESEILPPIRDVESKIKSHPKYSCISHDYSVLMEKFYNRVKESSSRFFPQSLEELENF